MLQYSSNLSEVMGKRPSVLRATNFKKFHKVGIRLVTISIFALISSMTIELYSQTATLDPAFGLNGMTIIPNTTDMEFFDFDAYGNIIAVGYTRIDTTKKTVFHMTIVKTNADGIVDENFGIHGIVKVTDYDDSMPYGMKITKDNKIVVVGVLKRKLNALSDSIYIMRFNENGTIDEGFGDNGRVFLFIGYIRLLNMESDDFMLIEKTYFRDDYLYPYYVKYNYEGAIDVTFGENGKIYLPDSVYPFCIKLLNNGSIIFAGVYCKEININIELGFCKITPAGVLDTNFANDGIWHKNIMQEYNYKHEHFYNVIEDNNGNLILSGVGLKHRLEWDHSAFLSKFSPNGVLDTSFGENGFYCFDFGECIRPIFHVGNEYITAGWFDFDADRLIYVHEDGSYGNYIYYMSRLFFLKDMKLQGNNKIIIGGIYKTEGLYSKFALKRVVF